MKYGSFIIMIFVLLACDKETVDLTGEWEWIYTTEHDDTHQVTIQLNQLENGHTVGFYCSAYVFGEFVDCVQADSSNKNLPNFVLKPVGRNQLKGNFRSNRGDETEQLGEIKISYLPANNKIFVDLIQEPSGSFYFPDEVEFVEKK